MVVENAWYDSLNATEGRTATVTCNEGYYFAGGVFSQSTNCQSSLQWNERSYDSCVGMNLCIQTLELLINEF